MRSPRYDVKSTCRAAIKLTASTSPEGNCLAGEEAARKNLAKDWSQFPSLERVQCMGTVVTAPSYVALLSCLEMKREVDRHREEEQRRATEPPKSTDMN